MKTLQQQIKYYADQFETRTRENGDTYVCAPEADEQLQHAIYEAHGDKLPEDWTYSTFNAILERMQDYDSQTLEDFEEYRGEIVDCLVDTYTTDLTAWLHTSNANVYYLSQALEEYGNPDNDGFKLLAMAQYLAIDEIYAEIYQLLEITKGESWE